MRPLLGLLLLACALEAGTKDPFRVPLAPEDRVQHAISRLTFGARPSDAAQVQQLGLKHWIDRQLHPEGIPENPALLARLQPFVSIRLTPAETYELYGQKRQPAADQKPETPFALMPVELRREAIIARFPQRVIADDLTESKILRAVYSERQLQEVLTDFWFNHFNVFLDKGQDRFLVGSYERDAIRPHVLSKFYDLLLATAQSPAMLFYLDNAESSVPRGKRGLNENYGRELLELHTLGVEGGYTQKDVTEVARCFTGWTMTGPKKGLTFEFNEKMHDEGVKVVLGHTIHAGGMQDGIAVLRLLAASPVTAHHICLQLAQRFVADAPPPALVDRMTKTYLKKDGDLREVMQAMLHSPEFWSQGAYQAKIKTPLELIASALRASNATVDSAFALNAPLQKMGEPLYRKIEPTGYSFANAEWINSGALLERVNFAASLAHNRIPGVRISAETDPEALAAPQFQKH